MRILIDARKAFDSGIGTYIRCVVPRVIQRLPAFEFAVAVEPGGSGRHDYLSGARVGFVEMASSPLGLREQAELRSVTRGVDYFWATSLAHPVFSRTPMIATVHDVAQLATRLPGSVDWLVKAAASLYFRSLRGTTRLVLFNSSFTHREFERYVGHARADTRVTPLGVDPAWFGSQPAPDATNQRPYLICVGNLRPHKNLLLLLEAFAMVTDAMPHDLVLVGKAEGFLPSDAETRAALSQLGDRARFSGFLSDIDLREAVAGADAVVVPSLYEGFGLPALEAMAAGVPVIAARAAALPEVCGDCARYFDPDSRDALVQQLNAHAAMPGSERKRRVDEGISRARQFTWEETARLTAEAIGTLAARGADRP